MNPIVVIATHNRINITSYNIFSLLGQSVKPKIVLVVSNINEKIYYAKLFPEISVLTHANLPLGTKWQFGIQHAYNLKADPLIILGSDDILGPKYIEICTELSSKQHNFIGLYRWYIHYKGKAFLCKYLAKQPLGGARAFSYNLLQKLNGKLFDTSLNRHLDDYTIKKCKQLGISCMTDDRLQVHAIKGNWICMNPFNLNHKNIEVISTHDSKEFFSDLPIS